MTTLFSLQKPYKVWTCDRQTRKSVVASSLLELKLHGAEKLSFDESTAISEIKVVLEADGTEVEDDGYFQTAEKDTIFILLRPGEQWLPLGVEALKSALSTIPGLVSDALNKLEASDKVPNWKVCDNNGIVSVVLSWDTRDRIQSGGESPLPDADIESLTVDSSANIHQNVSPSGVSNTQDDHQSIKRTTAQSPPILKHTSTSQLQGSLLTNTSITRGNLVGLEDLASQLNSSSRISRGDIILDNTFYPSNQTGETLIMEYDTDSDEDKTDQGSPHHDHNHCDFHCSGIHRQIAIKKQILTSSVGTSPIGDITPFPPALVARDGRSLTPTGTRRPGSKNVRFQDLEQMKKANGSEESDTETTDREDEQLCERYLLLTDQLAIGHERHLTVKDIGCILEKLSTKIVDVDKLERERESSDCHNWVIRALIRGESLREIGVVYNSQYFGIIEHPGYF